MTDIDRLEAGYSDRALLGGSPTDRAVWLLHSEGWTDDATALLAEVDRLTADLLYLSRMSSDQKAEVDRLTAEVVVEVQEVADTIPIACRAAVKDERARIWEAVIRLPTRGRHPTEIKGAVLDIVEPGRLQPHPGGIEQFQDEDR